MWSVIQERYLRHLSTPHIRISKQRFCKTQTKAPPSTAPSKLSTALLPSATTIHVRPGSLARRHGSLLYLPNSFSYPNPTDPRDNVHTFLALYTETGPHKPSFGAAPFHQITLHQSRLFRGPPLSRGKARPGRLDGRYYVPISDPERSPLFHPSYLGTGLDSSQR